MSIENKKCDSCGCDVKDHLTLVGGIEVCDHCLEALVKTTRDDILSIDDMKENEKHILFSFVCNMIKQTVLGEKE